MSRIWPGITPLNVYDLEYRVWVAFALSCDQEIERRKEEKAEMDRLKARRK